MIFRLPLLVLVLVLGGCLRTSYPAALLMSQEACAQLYNSCAEAAKEGTPCVRLPRCPMTAETQIHFEGRYRDLGLGWPWQ